MCLSSILSNATDVFNCGQTKAIAINDSKTVAWLIPSQKEQKGQRFDNLAEKVFRAEYTTTIYIGLKHLKNIIKTGYPKIARYGNGRNPPKQKSTHSHLGQDVHSLRFELKDKTCNIIPLNKNGDVLDFDVSIHDDSIRENRKVNITFDLFKSVIKEILSGKENKEVALKFSKEPLAIEYYEEGQRIEALIAPRININEEDKADVQEEEEEPQEEVLNEPEIKIAVEPTPIEEKPGFKLAVKRMVELAKGEATKPKPKTRRPKAQNLIDMGDGLKWSNSRCCFIVA